QQHRQFPCFYYHPFSFGSRYNVCCVSVIKTRMQSLEAQTQYRNSLHCAYRIFTEEGLRRFLTGTTPRVARLVVRFPFLLCSVMRVTTRVHIR
ncbi:hypothetical protein EDB85DRAFT_1957939, partial [Lactarius pseudohatsudake]